MLGICKNGKQNNLTRHEAYGVSQNYKNYSGILVTEIAVDNSQLPLRWQFT
jgi:hypothetical protein